MTILYLIIGMLLLLGSTVDIIWTSLWADGGAGPLSSRLATATWRGIRRFEGRYFRVRTIAGPLIIISTLMMWVGLLWAGWTFVFAGGENTLLDTHNPGPISWAERIYFVAYTLFTMGNGDFAPADGIWQIVTSFATASGMLFITLSVSYVLSVIGAVVDKRSFASAVSGTGTRSEEFIRAGWDGNDLRELDLPIDTISSDLSRLAKQHKAYPILHYYHTGDEEDSSAMAVAIFDDALTILRFGLPGDQHFNNALVKSARSDVQGYLQTLDSVFIDPANETPPPPDLKYLRDADIRTVSDDEFGEAIDDLTERRRLLLGAINADEWHWPPEE